ncbi:VOC family protein [Sphingobium phenoxybenzoativorans]|uniref:VOC family protein n=1 Tax=Sphingobium phenoxybenzoativorans TaxID=1592790 RepID=UPI00087238C2|nr:VOC family protein [Sphingobium phenoxybenzoativorans]
MTHAYEDGETLIFGQIALNTSDMSGSLRFYSEVLGFANSGANCAWGLPIQLQGLPPTARAVMWWMMGRERFSQLELFEHREPRQRPLPADWRPSDHGWTRMGVAVSDFDRAIAALKPWGVSLIHPPMVVKGGRRAAFRDPFAGIVIELMEDGPGIPGGIRPHHFADIDPAIIYMTSSVADLDDALHFYRDALRLEILPLNVLHDPADEVVWGLEGAARDGFVARAGTSFFEIVRYSEPLGRPQPAYYLACDQGVMNVGLCTANNQLVRDVIARLDEEGRGPEAVVEGPNFIATYVLDPGREFELFSGPVEMEDAIGFKPQANFFGAQSNALAGLAFKRRSKG